eukprot:gnl/Chilomastix_caulleri/197.p1 GENE.gnl/Chilomastix_caulleri/197~~gnl/Chilomastix_caulleri/197.p1  ORF type:complete len:323 (-),score=123.52 gnl/Chilomastix_caulleri/197:27-968(-)
MESKGSIVIALGGNAMRMPGEPGTYEGQLSNVQKACEQIIALKDQGWKVVLTSGNGPQVGAIQLQNQIACKESAEMPLHVCGAMSQGFITYMMSMCLGNILRERGDEAKVASIITQTIVDKEDPGFKNPTKPVGRFYSEEEAKEIAATGVSIKEDAGRGYRVVVASPKPIEIVELKAIESLVADDFVVVSTCGGGIPVINEGGKLTGVNAVIDKDLATSLLARQMKTDALCILTDVTNVCINYKKPDQKILGQVKADEMQKYVDEGHFAAGSMLPKVQAALAFVRATGNKAIITNLFTAVDALLGKCGTIITP